MEQIISKHEARHIMAAKGRASEYDVLVHGMLPSLVEQWVTQGLEVSIEHCFIRINGACSLKITCIAPKGEESLTVLLNGDAALFPIFSNGQLKTVVTSKRLSAVLSEMVSSSAIRLTRRSNASNDSMVDVHQAGAAA